MTELATTAAPLPVPVRRAYRSSIPKSHQASLDTRIMWLWNQRFGQVQAIWKDSKDVLDHTAADLILQAIMAKDLSSINLVFQRIEGGSISDQEQLDREPESMRL
jgi:hypothetical protein